MRILPRAVARAAAVFAGLMLGDALAWALYAAPRGLGLMLPPGAAAAHAAAFFVIAAAIAAAAPAVAARPSADPLREPSRSSRARPRAVLRAGPAEAA